MRSTLCKTLLAALFGWSQAMAQNITFLPMQKRADSLSVVIFQSNGEWVYSSKEVQLPKNGKPSLLGAPKRESYDLLTAQEQDGLSRFVADQQADLARIKKRLSEEQVVATTLPAKAHVIHPTRGHSISQPLRLAWPLVVIQSPNTVCVPQLEWAKSASWQDHLTCAEVPQ